MEVTMLYDIIEKIAACAAILSFLLLFTARAYARAVLGVVILSVCPSVRLSVCLFVTRVDCDKTK